MVGVRVGRIANTLSYQRSRYLKELATTVVLDVGANVVQYAREIHRTGYKGRIVSFEPLSVPFHKLQEYAGGHRNHECRQVALGRTDGTTPIYVSENVQSSSLLEVCDASVRACPSSACVSIETVQLKRLDTIRSEILQPADRVHLKLDTQGTEADVLLGARETLRKVVSMELEMSLSPLYKNQILLPQMCELLRESGFRCVWMEPIFTDPHSGHLLQVDALFLRQQ